ncbi:MAG: PQQ-dependent sugar dehydrogenase [Deltaproteobacteria bacterium]|nr:PQQ-dependent sugar dehydrogenase [Deltaproteobacteria bacterium]
MKHLLLGLLATALITGLPTGCGSSGHPVDNATGFVTGIMDELATPTQADWGSDGRLYVATLGGTIYAYSFDDDYRITGKQAIATLAGLDDRYILGIAGNPFDPPGTTTIYVSHSRLFTGAPCPVITHEYAGRVSMLTGPDFDTLTPVITGLPSSPGGHGVNNLLFDNDGDLLIAQGGQTNAGVPHCAQGGLPESPLSGAVLKARLSDPDFDGEITYVERDGGTPNNDQVDGDIVELAEPAYVGVFAAGLRNPFDLVLTTAGLLYATDNGPNGPSGAEGDVSTGPGTSAPIGESAPDELNLLEAGHYYGHPNRNRGIDDDRQNVYYGPDAETGDFTQAIAWFPSTTNGLDEYRAQTFGGAFRGSLMLVHWTKGLYRARLSANGRSVVTHELVNSEMPGIGLVAGPGGVLFSADYLGGKLRMAAPLAADSGGPQVHDIFPWRAPSTGGSRFVISGSGFGTAANTAVTIGGAAASITRVSPTRIIGTIPAETEPTADLVDVVVIANGVSRTLPAAFRYLIPPVPGP